MSSTTLCPACKEREKILKNALFLKRRLPHVTRFLKNLAEFFPSHFLTDVSANGNSRFGLIEHALALDDSKFSKVLQNCVKNNMIPSHHVPYIQKVFADEYVSTYRLIALIMCKIEHMDINELDRIVFI